MSAPEQPALPEMPRVHCKRLLMRPFCLYDAKRYQEAVNYPEVAQTADLSYPYEVDVAREWILDHPTAWKERNALFLCACLRDSHEIIGSGNLFLDPRNHKAEIGYLIGYQHWNKGYATEIAGMLIHFAFEHLQVNRVEGYHLARNPASGRVLEKHGLLYEACLRKMFLKDERYEDMHLRALLRSEYERQERSEVYEFL